MAKRKADDVGTKVLETLTIQPKKRRFEKAENFVSIYANDVQVQITPWDVRLRMGELQIPEIMNEESELVTIHSGEVRMSPQLAKRVAILLQRQLLAYEATFGEIPQPPEEPDITSSTVRRRPS